MDIYIYALCEPDTGEVRYIGQTCNLKQRCKAHMTETSNAKKYDWITSLKSRNLLPVVKVLEVVNDDDSAAQSEKTWVQYYRGSLGINLLNAKGSPISTRRKDRPEYKPGKTRLEIFLSKNGIENAKQIVDEYGLRSVNAAVEAALTNLANNIKRGKHE